MINSNDSKLDFQAGLSPSSVVSLRCPHCHREGSFSGLGSSVDYIWNRQIMSGGGGQVRILTGYRAGLRICPNPACVGLVFILRGPGVSHNFPPELIDFDATALPQAIANSLAEAVACHGAGAYRACALMVRRVLEELCADLNATGRDLKSRLGNLGANVVVPLELLNAADELRILGNDAAHVEARSYDNIGEKEASVSIELAKELLKAAYQYKNLVEKLRNLKNGGA